MVKTLPTRSEVREQDTWDVRSVFPSDEAWQQALKAIADELPSLERFEGKLGGSTATLLEGLKTRDGMLERLDRVGVYAGMLISGDITDQRYLAMYAQAQSISARAQAAVAYFEPEILAIEPSRLDEMVAREPGLAVYRHYFDKIDTQRGHIRSTEVEALLAEVTDLASSPAAIHSALEDADLRFMTIKDEQGEEVEIKQGNVWPLIRSQDREVRKAAWEAYADGYLSVKNTMAGTLQGGVKRDVFYSNARNYSNSLEAATAAANLPVQVFDNVIDAFKRHFPLWHRYWEIKRRAFGVDKLHGYDIDVPLVRTVRDIPYEKAVEMVIEGLKPLGDEYISVLSKALHEQRWVDIYPNVGKGSGAFSYGAPGTHPFLMLNYDNTLENVSTLVHELGHSMHSYFSWANQAYVYSHYSMFVAETASNFNQAMLRASLLKNNPDPDFELEILAEAMSNFHRYLFIMPTLARFELDCHQKVERGEGLTADDMTALAAQLFGEAFGPSVEVDEQRVGITWAQFPHLFGNFYVFQYATGISAANALADGVLREGEPAAKRYLDFLKAADAFFPLDALKLAGIDMMSPEPIDRAFAVLERMIDRLDELVGEGPLKPVVGSR